MDTTNLFAVGVAGDSIVVMKEVRRLTKLEALNLAAWLVALANEGNDFDKLLAAVYDS